jgi:hypothetical protein
MFEENWILKKLDAYARPVVVTTRASRCNRVRSVGQDLFVDAGKANLWYRERNPCITNLWALLNQLLITALGEEFECIRLVSVDGKVEHKRPGDSFVDDTTTGTTNDDTTMEPVPVEEEELTWSEEELVAKIQDIIQFFLVVLQVTGGDLAPVKCVWYLICHR